MLTGWAALFSHPLFRLEFTAWLFFGALGSTAAILTVSSVGLALYRRTTFDQGFTDSLNNDTSGAPILDDKSTAEKALETWSVPARRVPTYSLAFTLGQPPRVSSATSIRSGGHKADECGITGADLSSFRSSTAG